jgi:hypothetical protein
MSQVLPTMTINGDVFYLGAGKDEGWIMHLLKDESEEVYGIRIAWCLLSWRSIGKLSLLCGSDEDFGTLVCLNSVLGAAVLKVPLSCL